MTDGEPLAHPESAATEPSGAGHRFHRRSGFEIGGEDLGRIISLSDGVFAFALTLLVLSLIVPSSALIQSNGQLGAALNGDWPAFVGYAFAFVMIAIWWVVHNRTYQYIAKFDSTLVWINMALLAQIAVMPFILSVYSDYSGFRYAVILFAGIQVTLGLTSTALWEYAVRAKLAKPNIPAAVSRYFTRRGILISAIFAASIGLAFIAVQLAEASWIGVFAVQRLLTVAGD